MGMHVFSYLRQTLKRKDKSRDADWDFGARQLTPVDETITRSDSTSSTGPNSTNPRLRRSASLDDQRRLSLVPEKRTDAPQHQDDQQNGSSRVSAAVGSSRSSGDDVRGSQGRENGQVTTDSRVSTSGPRSGSPEDDVLLAAGETAKEIRTAGKPAETRRRVHSVVVAPHLNSSVRHTLRHTPSPLTTRDGIPISSSPTSFRSPAGSPTPSVQSFHSVQTGTSDATRRAALLSKRSMPQLHNVWENFLEEAAEDADSFSFPLPPQPGKYATVHPSSSHTNSGNQSLRHHHSPTSSSSSTSTATTAASVSTVRTMPRIPTSESLPQSPSAKRERGHLRTSHHTTSSTSSTTTSTHGSTSSMAAFSSASSMTTAHDDCSCDDSPQGSDDPVPPTPRSSASMSPKSFKFADPSLKPIVRRLRKSPTSPSLQCQALQRGVSPTLSTSGESYVSGMSSSSHSQSTTPTPSSACPTPSPTPYSGPAPKSAGVYVGRLGPVNSSMSGQYRRTSEVELPEQPLSPGSMRHRKSSTNSPRYSSLSGRSQAELKLFPSPEVGEGDTDEDVVSELGNYRSGSLRTRNQQQRQSIHSATFSTASTSPSSPTPSSSPVIPPIRRSSRQHLRTVVAQSVDALTIPRAKSVSNIKHEASERQRLTAVHSSPPLQVTKDGAIQVAAISTSSGAPVYLRESRSQNRLHSRSLNHARAQTLEHSPGQIQVIIDANSSGTPRSGALVHGGPSSPSLTSASTLSLTSASRPGQGRLRSGSASVVYNHNSTLPPAKTPPVRPPPAPPLDMTPARLRAPVTSSASRGGSSNSSSPLTPASAVQWGYAL